MIAFLRPRPTVSEEDAQRSLRFLAWEGLTSGAMFSLGSGGFMAAYALALGANNLQVGVLAALPFISQVVRLPAILLLERLRARKALGLPALLLSQLAWLPVGAVPFLLDTPGRAAVVLVIVLLAVRGLFSPVWVTTSTSWVRDLVPQGHLADYFGRRLSMMIGAMAAVGLGGSFFVQWWQDGASAGEEIYAFSFLLIGGAMTFGLLGPLFGSRAQEPLMPPAAESERSSTAMLLEPVRDRNYSQPGPISLHLGPGVQPGHSLLRCLYAQGHRALPARRDRPDGAGPVCQRTVRPGLGTVCRPSWQQACAVPFGVPLPARSF